jgi:hypothetical protein
VDLALQRPDLLDDGSWAAIEQHRDRLAGAMERGDAPLVLGSAKELVESVARVVTAAAGMVLPSNAEFNDALNAAHTVLDRQAGRGITNAQDVRAIAQQAKKLVFNIRPLRNDYGTGHGHAEVKSISAEMVSLVVSAAMLWVRWALVRLEHVLRREPDKLITALRTGEIFTRRSLRDRLSALVMTEQPEDVQRALGVALAQRAASGTFIAREVGVDGPATSVDRDAWPPAYRCGVAEGLMLSSDGFFSLEEGWVESLVAVLLPIAPKQLASFIHELADKVSEAGWPSSRRMMEDDALATSLAVESKNIPEEARAEWERLVDVINPFSGVEPEDYLSEVDEYQDGEY